jgi:hypothetical protein
MPQDTVWHFSEEDRELLEPKVFEAQPVENQELQALIREHAPEVQPPKPAVSQVNSIADVIETQKVQPPQPRKSRVVDYTSLIERTEVKRKIE